MIIQIWHGGNGHLFSQDIEIWYNNNMFSLQKNKDFFGFTLIELIVSISIITLITGAFLTNYHSTNKRSELINSAQKMVSDIRLAQQFSLSTKQFNGAAPKGGWGAYFNKATPSSYIIFADNNEPGGDQNYDAGEEFRTVSLPAGISLNSIKDKDGNELNTVAIVFLPPDPATYIAGVMNNKARIALKENAGSSVKTVEVNFLGLIEVID